MKDEWVTTALSNDAVVVELLFRLKQSSCEPPAKPLPHPHPHPPPLGLPFGWGHRQPRSKPPISAKKDSGMTTSTTRCSPTTPLSWSGGAASPSDGAYEDCSNSSRPSFDLSRSKGSYYANEAPNSACKKSRKKKTFAELKEEEHFLLKERVNLTKELATLHVTLEEQKARRENLKRIKIDLNVNSSSEPTTDVVVPSRGSQMEEASTTSSDPVAAPSQEFPRNASFTTSTSTAAEMEVDNNTAQQQRCFFLPDLNMMPSEDDYIAVPYGIS